MSMNDLDRVVRFLGWAEKSSRDELFSADADVLRAMLEEAEGK